MRRSLFVVLQVGDLKYLQFYLPENSPPLVKYQDVSVLSLWLLLKHSPATSQKSDPAGSRLPVRIATKLLVANLVSVQDVVMLTVDQR
jgi:hypothetical protein